MYNVQLSLGHWDIAPAVLDFGLLISTQEIIVCGNQRVI